MNSIIRARLSDEQLDERYERARQALADACHIVWYHKSLEHEGCERRSHFWSIPADKDRDVDCIIGDALIDFVNEAKSRYADNAELRIQAQARRDVLRGVINRHCTCGGAGPGESGCIACAIWHEVNGG